MKGAIRGFARVVGNPLEQEIIGLYSDNISSIYSINQIATKLGKKYPYINKKVTLMIKSRIFKKIIIGRSYLCSLNLRNDETVYLLILNEIKKKKASLESHPSLRAIMDYIEKASKASPLQLAMKADNSIIFVLDKREDKEHFEKGIMKEALRNHKVEVHTKESFLTRLVDDRALQEEHILLHGFEKYYSYLREVETELNMRYSKLLP